LWLLYNHIYNISTKILYNKIIQQRGYQNTLLQIGIQCRGANGHMAVRITASHRYEHRRRQGHVWASPCASPDQKRHVNLTHNVPWCVLPGVSSTPHRPAVLSRTSGTAGRLKHLLQCQCCPPHLQLNPFIAELFCHAPATTPSKALLASVMVTANEPSSPNQHHPAG